MARDLYLESRIMSADPTELTRMLYEHAVSQVGVARAALKRGDIKTRTAAISKTLAILGELEGSLNHEVGGKISRNLARLYQYIRKALCAANLNKDDAKLAEAERLLQTLFEGWSAMQRSVACPPPEMELAMAGSEMHGWCA